jgi:hypothetical protein
VSAYDGFASAYGGGAYECILINCTLTGNSAFRPSGSGRFGGGAAYCTLNNCITFANTASSGPGYGPDVYQCALSYCWGGDPLFVDTNGWANLRLQSNSPCINAGNNAYATNATDLDGNPRIAGGTVDIGAYEYQSLGLISFGVVSNQFGFNVTGQSNWVIVLEASSDFANWTPMRTNTLSGSPFPFHDPAPPNLPRRFYRARME